MKSTSPKPSGRRQLPLSHDNFAWQNTTGTQSKTAKLTAQEVRWIRASKKTALELAEKYKVTAATIRRVRARQVYKDVV